MRKEAFFREGRAGEGRGGGAASSIDGVPIDAGLRPRLAEEFEGTDAEDDGIAEELDALEKQLQDLKERRKMAADDPKTRVSALKRKLAE
eukprot:7436110-Karenia_brevis.AAC.1